MLSSAIAAAVAPRLLDDLSTDWCGFVLDEAFYNGSLKLANITDADFSLQNLEPVTIKTWVHIIYYTAWRWRSSRQVSVSSCRSTF